MRGRVDRRVAKLVEQLIGEAAASNVAEQLELIPGLKERIQQQAAQAAHDQLSDLVAEDVAPEPGGEPGQVFPDLDTWVREWLAPTYWRVVSGPPAKHRWCASWWDHPEALERLQPLWELWERVRGEGDMLQWWSYADQHMPILLALTGPFARCSSTNHYAPENDTALPCTPAPPQMRGEYPDRTDTAAEAGAGQAITQSKRESKQRS
ncbi:DUF4913 domain-containing protein [Nocardia terpenica]|uniref:DUF4913 domain-containing protein n=1 Tax=Nocardia terpenica TaxID=455432 RepID=A0A6G9ZE74_9NOCA|nr:DUF4913 domain-containing protein [Nocardia terpenica]QIS23647.1 DUF4913 domain-containing protein [Nocardia terpenica]